MSPAINALACVKIHGLPMQPLATDTPLTPVCSIIRKISAKHQMSPLPTSFPVCFPNPHLLGLQGLRGIRHLPDRGERTGSLQEIRHGDSGELLGQRGHYSRAKHRSHQLVGGESGFLPAEHGQALLPRTFPRVTPLTHSLQCIRRTP